VEVRRVRGGRQSSASSTEVGDLSPQCESYAMVSWFLAYGATHGDCTIIHFKSETCLPLHKIS
jgi:hypothetical protein